MEKQRDLKANDTVKERFHTENRGTWEETGFGRR